MSFLLFSNLPRHQVRFPAQRNAKPSLGSVVVTMNRSQPTPVQMPRWVAEWFLEASEVRTRTHVPHYPTEGTVMTHDTSEVTAQRMTAAFNAVLAVLDTIEDNREQLQALPSGRALVERADATRRAMENGPG